MVAYETLGFAGRLNGSGSGSGWAGEWTAKTGGGLDYTAEREPALFRWHGPVRRGR